MVGAEAGLALEDRGCCVPMVLCKARVLLCAIFALLAPACEALGEEPLTGAPAPFEASFHAQLLMRVVTGSVYPAVSYTGHIVDGELTKQPYEHFLRKYGLDWPSVGHTMVGWVRLQQLYEALRTCALEGVPGDFLEAGVWRGGASIFAASVLREMGCLGAPGGGAEHNESCVRARCARDVWVRDPFQGFEPDPWDGDHSWTTQNPVGAVSDEDVRHLAPLTPRTPRSSSSGREASGRWKSSSIHN